MLYCRYGDRTPKSDQAKAFAMIWFLVGLVVFSLFSAGLTSDLTVVVSTGGPTGQFGPSSKEVQNVCMLLDKYIQLLQVKVFQIEKERYSRYNVRLV